MSYRQAYCWTAIALWLLCGSGALADSARRYTVTDFGAVGDGKTLNTKIFQTLIDRISADGGGTVVIPAGTFMTGSLFFKKDVSLYLESNSILKGTANQADYPQVQTRFEGVERPYAAALLNWDSVQNASLSGDGTIDGSGDLWMQRAAPGARATANSTTVPAARGRGAPATAPAGRGLLAAGRAAGASPLASGRATTLPSANPLARGATTAAATRPASAASAASTGRPRLICFSNSSNIRVSDVHLMRPASWCLHILYCQDVAIDGITIRTIVPIPSSDGIVVDSSSHVAISHCAIDCNDDDICLKSGKDTDGRRVNRPTEYVTITSCTIGSGEGIAIGSEVTGSIRHVLVERCRFDSTGQAVRVKSMSSRGGTIQDIVFRDCQLQDVRDAFEFDMNWLTGQEREAPAATLTRVREVQLINVSGTAKQLGKLVGIDTTQLQDIHWQDCTIAAQTPMTIQKAHEIDLSGLHATVPSGNPFAVQNSDDILFPTTRP